jgi:lipoate-protein ligase A
MAVDEALLRLPESGWVLRFYEWRRPTVSLGYGQPMRRGVDQALARSLGVDVVRRPTGGRAVLHADEITYAIAAPADEGALAGGISSSYRRIARGLQAGLALLGVEAHIERSGAAPTPNRKGPCFAARTRYELSARGRKLAGSAQRRADGRLLQHGSLLMGPPRRRLWSALGAGHEDAAGASVGLDDLIAVRPSRRTIAACLSRGISDALGLEPRTSRLTVRELRGARGLAARYRDAGWTRRR